MLKILEKNNNSNILYTCENGDSLESISAQFNISIADIMRDNPLFSSVYPGCMLYLTGIGKRRVVVGPLQTLYDIAKENGVTIESLKRANNLKTDTVFVGMQLLIE